MIGSAFLSHALASISFLLLFAFLSTNTTGYTQKRVLVAAGLLTFIWSGTIAYQSLLGRPLTLLGALLELARSAGWIFFLLALLAPLRSSSTGAPSPLRWSRIMVSVLFAAVAVATLGAAIRTEYAANPVVSLFSGILGRLFIALIGMVLVEQVFRNAAGKEKWSVKFACLGIGCLFAFDFYLYSDAALFRRINVEIWIARGVVDALTAPLIAISATRSRQWSGSISISRRFLFHSATVIGSAIYLIAMAAAGYALRYAGGEWGPVVQVTFLFGAVVLLLAILFSGTFRSRLKVFISKHFFAYSYDYREEWIRFTRTLSEQGPGLGERSVQAVASLVESTGGALWIQCDGDAFECVAEWNLSLDARREPAESPFCQFLKTTQWVVDLQQYETDPAHYENLALPDWLSNHPKAWLVVPLMLHKNLFGYILLAHPRSPITLNWEITDLLKIAGSQAASYLAQQEAAKSLMVARQFESVNRMSTFVVHDLKNLVSQLTLLMSNAEKHKHRPEFIEDMVETVDYSVSKMKLLLEKLSRKDAFEQPAPVRMNELLRNLIATKSMFIPRPGLRIDAGQELHVFANASRLERVIGHMIQNAIEATRKDGTVMIRLQGTHNSAIVEIEDNGHGMSESFIRERLFRPFETTKSAGMGIGLFETREYIHELGGHIDVESSPAGTLFRITLPLHRERAAAVLTAA